MGTPCRQTTLLLGSVRYIRLHIVLICSHYHAEYPADYVSPVMDLFVEDQVPFGVPSTLSCPKDSEHLERAFDFLQYQHLLKKLGVSSVINQHTLVRLFRILGNTSSGSSFEFLAAAKLARLEKNGMYTFRLVVLQRLTHVLQQMANPAIWLSLTQLDFPLYLTRN